MLLSEREELMKDFFKNALEIVAKKGNDYDPSGTAFAEIKKQAEEIGVTPEQYLLTHMIKHFSALKSFVKTQGELQSEDIHSRLVDLANYAALFHCLILEKRN